MISNEKIEKIKEQVLDIEKDAVSVNKVMDAQIVERIKKLYEEIAENGNN